MEAAETCFMTNDELRGEVKRMQDAETACRQRVAEFIARATIITEHQQEWNCRMESLLNEIREKLNLLDGRWGRAAGWAAGAGAAVALLGKFGLDKFLGGI